MIKFIYSINSDKQARKPCLGALLSNQQSNKWSYCARRCIIFLIKTSTAFKSNRRKSRVLHVYIIYLLYFVPRTPSYLRKYVLQCVLVVQLLLCFCAAYCLQSTWANDHVVSHHVCTIQKNRIFYKQNPHLGLQMKKKKAYIAPAIHRWHVTA